MTPEDRAVAAGEYALGLLEGEDRAAFEAQLASDAAARADLAWWNERLSWIGLALAPKVPRPVVWLNLAHRMMTTAPAAAPAARAGGSTGLKAWAAMATAASMVLAFGLYREVTAPPPAPQVITERVEVPVPATTFVAYLQMPDSTMHWTLSVSPDGGAIKVRAGGEPPAAAADFDTELWLITDGGPVSLGVIPKAGEVQRGVPGNLAFASGATVAVSLEPQGGSPTGQPTGPVVTTATILLAT